MMMDIGELVVVIPPTPCQTGKRPPALKKNPAGQQGARGGGHEPLKLTKYSGSKTTQKTPYKVLRRRTGLVFACFASVKQ